MTGEAKPSPVRWNSNKISPASSWICSVNVVCNLRVMNLSDRSVWFKKSAEDEKVTSLSVKSLTVPPGGEDYIQCGAVDIS